MQYNGHKLRHEQKYLISYHDYHSLAGSLEKVMQHDRFSTDGGYFIRSLYFDDVYGSAYAEKDAGVRRRRKHRLRIYDLSADVIKYEVKDKFDSYISKVSSKVSRPLAEELIGGCFDNAFCPDEKALMLGFIDSQSGSYHTSFRLSSSGETVLLTNSHTGTSLSVAYSEALPDVSYGLIRLEDSDSFAYKWLDKPTPGAANEGNYADSAYLLPSLSVRDVLINEYMTANTCTLYDADGDYDDWAELYNSGSEPVDLSGCYLTDEEYDTGKWMFPEGCVIAPYGYLTVYLSGKDRYENGELHASFRIGRKDTILAVYDKSERLVDRAELLPLPDDVSYGRTAEGGWGYFSLPTPGKSNAASGYAELPESISLDGQLYISEVCAADMSSNKPGNNLDWIEIFNSSANTVELGGYTLKKSGGNTEEYVFPQMSLAPGAYGVIYAAGRKAEGGFQAPFRVDSAGDTLYLADAAGRVLDSFDTGKLVSGTTSGRTPDGKNERVYFSSVTKCARNPDEAFTGYAKPPEINSSSCYCEEGSLVTITVPEGTEVHYTTDGSEPDRGSPLYDGAIEISKSVTIKAAAFCDGLLKSDTVFSTFITEQPHTIPVMCISSEDDGLFGATNGIYNIDSALYGSHDAIVNGSWERPAAYEYYVDGKLAASFSAGIRLFGSGSRFNAQRSLSIMLRDCYGRSSITYPFFKYSGHATAKALVLRSGGQDQRYTFLRDGFCTRVALLNGADLVAADAQPVAVYINGRYWGLYELREKINEDYFEVNYGMDKDGLDIILNNGVVSAGTYARFLKLYQELGSFADNSEEQWRYITDNIDVDSAVDHIVYETFFKNIDYGNIRVYYDTNMGKWRWILFDMDMSLYEGSDHLGISKMSEIMKQDVIKNELLQNARFRRLLLERYSEQLAENFDSERLLGILNDLAAEIEPEIERNYDRWKYMSYGNWQKEMDALRGRIPLRRSVLIRELKVLLNMTDDEFETYFGAFAED